MGQPVSGSKKMKKVLTFLAGLFFVFPISHISFYCWQQQFLPGWILLKCCHDPHILTISSSSLVLWKCLLVTPPHRLSGIWKSLRPIFLSPCLDKTLNKLKVKQAKKTSPSRIVYIMSFLKNSQFILRCRNRILIHLGGSYITQFKSHLWIFPPVAQIERDSQT